MDIAFPKMFQVIKANGNVAPLVLDSPHSGTFYPADFHYICPQHWLRQTEDSFVDRLFADAPQQGVPLLKAHFTRSYIDVNRAVEDLDPVLIHGVMPFELKPTERSLSGYGLIRHICRGQNVYAGKITPENILQRVDECYVPYHDALETLLADAHKTYDIVWHVNCHSMPSHFVSTPRPDFIIGDRDGSSAEAAFTQTITAVLQKMGYSVAHNDPYKGVEILKRYGRPRDGFHSVQLEINRALYMNEETLEPLEHFHVLKNNMAVLVGELKRWIEQRLEPQRMAAE